MGQVLRSVARFLRRLAGGAARGAAAAVFRLREQLFRWSRVGMCGFLRTSVFVLAVCFPGQLCGWGKQCGAGATHALVSQAVASKPA